MSVRRSIIILALLMLLSPVLIFALRAQQMSAQQQVGDPLAQYEQYVVTTGRVEAVVSAVGAVEADQVIELSFRAPGRVQDVLVRSGDYVFAGEPLVQLDDETQQAAYDQAVLVVERAQIQLADLMTPPGEEDLRIARANVDSAWGQYLSVQNAVTDDDIRAAELNYEAARRALELSNERAGLPDNNLPSAQAGAASFNAEIARLQLENLRTGTGPQAGAAYARVVQAQRELERIEAGAPQFQIDAAELAVRQADAQLRRAEINKNRTLLTAPFDGLVSSVTAEVGALVAPGFAILELTDLDPLQLTVQVDEIDLRLVAQGMDARVEVDALPDVVIPAEVGAIALVGTSNVNGVVSYDVRLSLEDPDPRVRVGMTAEANIIVDSREDVLYIPNYYIRLDLRTGQAFVNILRPSGAIEEIEVRLGLQGRDNSEVLSGVEPGDMLLVDLTAGLSIFGE
jgi:HlyD family secretion protein